MVHQQQNDLLHYPGKKHSMTLSRDCTPRPVKGSVVRPTDGMALFLIAVGLWHQPSPASFICIIGRGRRRRRRRIGGRLGGLIVERRQRIRALDDPTECKEGDTSKNGGAPSMRVPFGVLSSGELPLLPERCRVRIRCVWRVPVSDVLTREVGFGVGGVDLSGSFLRRRGKFLIGVLVMISHS